MLQHSHRASVTLAAGKSGSGKTTFAYRYLLNSGGLVCRFIFDPRGEAEERLRIKPARTVNDLEADLATGWVIFDPSEMFPGQHPEAFAFFCDWSWQASARGPGRKCVVVDEVWKYCSPHSIPPQLAQIVQDGRKNGVESLFLTQRPNRLNGAITNELTEAVCFRLQDASACETMEELGLPPGVPHSLPLGSFHAVNVSTGGELAGKVF